MACQYIYQVGYNSSQDFASQISLLPCTDTFEWITPGYVTRSAAFRTFTHVLQGSMSHYDERSIVQ